MTGATTLLRTLVTVLLAVGALGGLAQPAWAAPGDEPGVLTVQTVPATPGARVAADGRIAVADQQGIARLAVPNFTGLSERFSVLPTRVSDDRKVEVDRIVGTPDHGHNGEPLVVGLSSQRLVSWQFTNPLGRLVPTESVTLLELKSSTGKVVILRGEEISRPLWLDASRTQQSPRGLVNKEMYWTISRAVVDGAEVVNRGQQKFFPNQSQRWSIGLLFYRVEFVGRDLLFGSTAGEGVELVQPDGEVVRAPFVNGIATLNSVARGSYDVRVYGPGLSFVRPLSVSTNQTAEIEVITRFDLWLVGSALAMTALSLVLVGRRHRIIGLSQLVRRRLQLLPQGNWRWVSVRGLRWVVVGLSAVALALMSSSAFPARADEAVSRPTATRAAPATTSMAPAFAYYYIWFEPSSWLRAKTDYPLMGRYSSDDRVAMRRHVQMAKAAGLTGFLVSWKDTAHLSHRLSTLVSVAQAESFELAIVYQGLDFYRNPLPPHQIAEDLQGFARKYADSPVFDHFGKPVVVITGTEDYSVEALEQMRLGTRDQLQVLASAKSPEEYQRTADVMDGDAYYWSSGNPRTDWYRDRLADVADAVRDDNGLWLAPAAAGFDARVLGGSRVIDRENGDTLKASLASAQSTDPDAIAVISWNEFSENSHIEPSENYGTQELEALAQVLGGRVLLPDRLAEVDKPREERRGLTGWGALVALLFLAAGLNFFLAVRRSRETPSPEAGPPSPETPGHRRDAEGPWAGGADLPTKGGRGSAPGHPGNRTSPEHQGARS